jgi:glutamyl-Q tRNA(Asp) synthetase
MPLSYIGRFAPSPTGPLHLGSLATALGSYLDARVHHGKWLLRIEDIDQGRCNTASVEHILQTLRTHGLQWQGEVWFQSQRHSFYQAAIDQLQKKNLVYFCACTRREIDDANRLRTLSGIRIYPGTCKHGIPNNKTARTIRFHCPLEPVDWQDHHLGHLHEDLNSSSGDFVLKRGDGFWAYHLAVVVDDLANKVNHIVRGDDLVGTTARQVAIWQALQFEETLRNNEPIPFYWHLPVICSKDGKKLSKQTGAKAVPENDPILNLNTVWQHFGLDKIKAYSTSDWLKLAAPVWAQYRVSQVAR